MQNEIKNVYSEPPPSSVFSQSAPNDDGLLTPMSILSSSPTASKKNISSSSPSSIISTSTSSSSIPSPINDITNINFNSNSYYHSHRRHNSNGNSIQHKNINGLHKSKSITELPQQQQQQTSSPLQPQRLPYRPQHPTQELRKSFSSLQEFLNYTEKISGANIQPISSVTGTKNNSNSSSSSSSNFIIVNSVDKSNSVKYIKTVNPHYYIQPDNRSKRDEPISRHSPKSLIDRKGYDSVTTITSQSSSPPSPGFFPRYAGAAFNNSPPPDSLPLPNFSMTPKTPNGSPTQGPLKNIQRPLDLSEMNLDSTSHNRNSATNSPKSSIEGIPMNTGNQYNILGTILIGTANQQQQQQTHANGYMNSLLSSPKSTTGNVDAVYLDHLSTSLKKMLNIQSVNA